MGTANAAARREPRLAPAGRRGARSAATLSGAKIYVSTWDYDGGYRALAPEAGPYGMGGGDAGTAKVMDETAVIVLP